MVKHGKMGKDTSLAKNELKLFFKMQLIEKAIKIV